MRLRCTGGAKRERNSKKKTAMVHNIRWEQMVSYASLSGQITSVFVLQVVSVILLVALLVACFFLVRCNGRCRTGRAEKARKDVGEQLNSMLGTGKVTLPERELEEREEKVTVQDPVAETAPVRMPEPIAVKETRSVDMDEIMRGLQEENLRELVRDRLEQISRRTEDWALEVVDSLGEMEALKTEVPEDARGLRTICAEMRRRLAELGCEVVDSDEWDPERQRAIKTKQTLPPGSTPQITKKVSFGLCVQGHLARKQEVCINK